MLCCGVSEEAAEKEPAWKGAGQEVGLQIWRIVVSIYYIITGPLPHSVGARLVTVAGVCRRRLSASVTRRICNVIHPLGRHLVYAS